jgi:hypothetical protein
MRLQRKGFLALLVNLIRYRRILTFCLIASIAGLLSSCEHGVGPEISEGPRTYVWTFDTLHTEFNVITGLWGSSAGDLWAGGLGGAPEDFVCHYDGKKWTTWFEWHPQAVFNTAHAIFGFASNDIWMGGQSFGYPGAGLSHWDGTQWGKHFDYEEEPTGSAIVTIDGIWGPRPNNMYAMGSILYRDDSRDMRGFILRYDGSSWKEILRQERGFQYHFLQMVGVDDSVFVTEYRPNRDDPNKDVMSLCVLRDNQLAYIYSDAYDRTDIMNLAVIDRKLYVTLGRNQERRTYLHAGGSLIEFLRVDYPNYEYALGGRSENDIFLSMHDGLAHFNGVDCQYLCHWPTEAGPIEIMRIAVFQKEIFVSLLGGTSVAASLVLHGRLLR